MPLENLHKNDDTNPIRLMSGLVRVIHVGFAESLICPVIGPLRTWRFALEDVGPVVIQAPKREPRIMRYDLNNLEWAVTKPMLPNKPRGVPPVNDRRDLNGICWLLQSVAPWRNLPEGYGPLTKCQLVA